MSSESLLFLMNMSETMGSLWPAPIEMNPIDEAEGIIDSWETNGSRWAICSDIIKLMIDQTIGCGVEIFIGKNTDLAVSMTRGNSEEKLGFLQNVLQALSKTIKANGFANPDIAVREISKFIANCSENTSQQVHWFVDTESYIQMDTCNLNKVFPSNLVTLYVIGELRNLHDNYDTAKNVCSLMENAGVDVRFLMCLADLKEIKDEILSEKRYEFIETEVSCIVGPDTIKLKILQEKEVGKKSWPISKIRFSGFIPELELCQMGVLNQEATPHSHAEVSVESSDTVGNEIMWSLASHLISEVKRPLLGLFKCYEGRKFQGFCLMTAVQDETEEIQICLIRPTNLTSEVFKNPLFFLNEISEPPRPLCDESYSTFAPLEARYIRRRLTKIEQANDPAKIRKVFLEFADEYTLIDAKDTFLKHTVVWQKEFLKSSKDNDENNN